MDNINPAEALPHIYGTGFLSREADYLTTWKVGLWGHTPFRQRRDRHQPHGCGSQILDIIATR